MKLIECYLVIRNGDHLRVVNRYPKLDPNEIAVQLKIKVPTPPKIAAVIELELPEAPVFDPADVTVAEWIEWEKAREEIKEASGD